MFELKTTNYNDNKGTSMKQRIKVNTFALVITAALASNLVFAAKDTTVEAKKSGLERIEVTARRTVENIQKVPVSVTSIGASDLAENGMTNVTDIQQYAANTTLQVSRGTSSTLTAYIRGIGQQDPLWGFEPGVGVYVDDVYIARPQGAVMEILDVERIEILRGPQGTLYGKNTIGGAMKYITKKMSGDNELGVEATFGNYGTNNYKASGQLALMDDKLYVGGAIASLNRDGFGEFKNNGEENYNKDILAGRLSLEYHASDTLFFRLNYDKTTDDSNAKGGYRLVPSLLTGQQPYDNVFDSDTSLPVTNKVETSGGSLTIDWNINDALSFKSVTSSRTGDTQTNIDFDNTALKSFDVPAVYDDEQLTQELQLSYVGKGITAVGGVYYYDGTACGAFDVQLEVLGQVLGLPGFTLENGGCVDTKSYSAYGQTSFDLNKKWSMTLGGRYTKDKKSADVYKYTFFKTIFPGELEAGAAAPINFDNKFENSETWSHFSPRVSVEYHANDDLMYYASYANGFKSGGFNMRADIGADSEGSKPFDPEIVDTYEIGFKSEPTDNLRINASYFFSDYQNMQVTVQRATSDDNFVARVLNAGKSEIQGVELESIYAATDNLTVNLGLGYIDAKFVEFLNVDPTTGAEVDQADELGISNTPDWSINLGLSYNYVAEIGDFVFTSNIAYRGDTQIFEAPSELDQGAYTLMNLGVIFYASESDWIASLQVKNAFDKEYRIAGYNFRGLGLEDTVIGYYGDPQAISFTIGYTF